mgnify:CR=1 FL=1
MYTAVKTIISMHSTGIDISYCLHVIIDNVC